MNPDSWDVPGLQLPTGPLPTEVDGYRGGPECV